MDKERISAARKRLKEFQRSKKEQNQKIQQEHSDLQKNDHEQVPSFDNLAQAHDEHFQQLKEDSEFEQSNGNQETKTSESPNLFNDAGYIIASQSPLKIDTSFQNPHPNHETTNGTSEFPQEYNFIPNFQQNNHEISFRANLNLDETDYNKNSPNDSGSQFPGSNLESNIQNNISSSLQKEHLLQMANAVASLLEDEQNLDESALNNCDLEQKNQFLNSCLEEQKKLVNQLHIQVSQCNSKISELEAVIATKDTEFDSKLIREVNPLKEQVHLDAQTIGILVGEKEELSATNVQCQTAIKQKTEEVIELSDKLKTSQQRVVDLERQTLSWKNDMENLQKSYEQLQQQYSQVTEKLTKLEKRNEDLELEISEFQQKLNYKNVEVTNLQVELQEKLALLSLSELRIQQLSNSQQEMNSLEQQHHTTRALEQQLSQMKQTLESVNDEKDEASKKYQSYVQQLDERQTKLLTELETSKKIIAQSDIREQSYIQRLSELEQQLQRERARAAEPVSVQDQSEKIEMLTKSMDNLVLEQENLQSLLNERDREIERLEQDLRELQNMREQSVEASKLATALQSEQLGASRAVSQNQQLKTQLDEMHDAFIALSNTKLDLTEQLQAERTIGKKLNAQLNEVEQQVYELKDELANKEAILVKVEKEKLHTAQIEDQVQHYQAQSHSISALQEELQIALVQVGNLKRENQILHSKLKATDTDDPLLKTVQEINETVDGETIFGKRLRVEKESQQSLDYKTLEDKSVMTSETETETETSSIPSIPEPIKKLENRFKETMERVAELTDEKQRLEHLVLQLQGETETIGEYVTLYQKQRTILQEKAKEKENTFKQLLEQRNQQQVQLHKLKVLVAELLKSKNSSSHVTTATVAEENMSLSDHPGASPSNNIEVIDGHINKPDDTTLRADRTTSQILDLLTEIKGCNDSCILEPNFHPCPWCSGKLITV